MSGPTAGGTDVVITGTGFQTGAVVRFGATAGTVQQLTTTAITARTPAGSAGLVAISVTNPDGGAATQASAFTYLAPPTITGSSPVSGPTAGGTDVVITGTGFQTGAVVRFGATAGVVQQLTTTAITARTPAGSAGLVAISVTNPDGGAATQASAFTYQPPPTITGSSPVSGPTAGGTDVVITGTGFQTGAVVRFGATAGTVQQLTTTAITARTPAGSAGLVAISVTNPDGGAATRVSAFTYLAPPTITGSSPVSGPTAGGTDVVITGTGFQTGAVVRFGATAGVVQQLTTTAITARTPAGSAGLVAISVTNPDGGAATQASAFTYLAPPTITGSSPVSGPTAGGTDVVITGTGFQTGAVVRFGATAGTVQQLTTTAITARTPAGSAGLVAISVTNPDGGAATRVSAFTYLAAADDHGVVTGEWPDRRRHGCGDHRDGLPDRRSGALRRDRGHGAATDDDGDHRADTGRERRPGSHQRDQPRRRRGDAGVGLHVPAAADDHGLVTGEWPNRRRHGCGDHGHRVPDGRSGALWRDREALCSN